MQATSHPQPEHVESRDSIAAADLAVHANEQTRNGAISNVELQRWLTSSGFAAVVDGRLVATPRGRDVAAGLG